MHNIVRANGNSQSVVKNTNVTRWRKSAVARYFCQFQPKRQICQQPFLGGGDIFARKQRKLLPFESELCSIAILTPKSVVKKRTCRNLEKSDVPRVLTL